MWTAIIGGALSIVLLLLRQWLKEKSKVDEAHDTAREIQRKVNTAKYHITNGRADLAKEEMDFLDRDLRALLRLRKKVRDKRGKSSGS